MNWQTLKPFLTKAAASKNPTIKKQADDLLDTMVAEHSFEQVVEPQLQGAEGDSANKKQNKDEVDALILPAFPELAKPEGKESTFGKAASAYVSDVTIKELAKDTRESINKLIPILNPSARIVQYGMVVEELLPKVDPHNFESAEDHIKQDMASKGKRAMGDKFQDKFKTKYILVLNDRIVDGHHYLALAKVLGITCSLRVLDLTPLRFQEKKATWISLIKQSQYGQNNYSRKGGFKTPRYSRVSSVLRRERTR